MRSVLGREALRARVNEYTRRRIARDIPAPDAPHEIAGNLSRVGRPALAFRYEAAYVLEHLLNVGPLPRDEVPRIANTSERTARRLVHELLEEGFATSASPRGALLPRIPVHAAPYLLPTLFLLPHDGLGAPSSADT